MDEEVLEGAVGAVRVGSTVRKTAGPWSPTIQALLRHLGDAGFDLAPTPLGFDDRGREVLSWVDGAPASRPWPAELLQRDGVVELAHVLRRYHDVVAGFDPGVDAMWRSGARPVGPGEVVCHGDFAPWNTLWHRGHVVGVIDWDMAEPGRPAVDVAFLALHVVPLRPDAIARDAGFVDEPPRAERLRAVCDAYGGLDTARVLEEVAAWHVRDRRRTTEWGEAGREPWATFLARGDVRLIEADAAWLERHGRSLA